MNYDFYCSILTRTATDSVDFPPFSFPSRGSFVRSFLLCGQVFSLLWTPVLRPPFQWFTHINYSYTMVFPANTRKSTPHFFCAGLYFTKTSVIVSNHSDTTLALIRHDLQCTLFTENRMSPSVASTQKLTLTYRNTPDVNGT